MVDQTASSHTASHTSHTASHTVSHTASSEAKTPETKAPETKAPASKELSNTMPKMKLEQDPIYGNWVYSREAWLYGPEVVSNGVLPLNTTERTDAERYVNSIYPNSFPEPPPESTKEKTSEKDPEKTPEKTK